MRESRSGDPHEVKDWHSISDRGRHSLNFNCQPLETSVIKTQTHTLTNTQPYWRTWEQTRQRGTKLQVVNKLDNIKSMCLRHVKYASFCKMESVVLSHMTSGKVWEGYRKFSIRKLQAKLLFTYKPVCGTEVVLAGHICLQQLRHLLDAFNFTQKLENVLVLNPLDPQLSQLIPFTVEQHLTREEVLLHLLRKGRYEKYHD